MKVAPRRTSAPPAAALRRAWQRVTVKLEQLILAQPRAAELVVRGVDKAIDILLEKKAVKAGAARGRAVTH